MLVGCCLLCSGVDGVKNGGNQRIAFGNDLGNTF